MKIINKISKEISYQTGVYTLPPEFVSIIITMNCNFRCESCHIWENQNVEELNESEWKNIANKLSSELKPDTFIEINGGEALIKKNIVITLAKELKKNFKKIALNSNGSLFNDENLDELKNAGIDLIKISFYSLNKSTHDNLRGHPSAYDNVMRSIELINKKGINLEIGILITSKNIKEIPELIKYLQKLPNTSIVLQALDEKIESIESKNKQENKIITNLWPNENDSDEFFKWVFQNNKNIKNSIPNIKAIHEYYMNPDNIIKYICFAGQRNIVIYPNGDLSLCFKRDKIGNINKQELKDILINAKSERKNIKYCKKYCRIVGCNFSRGIKEFIKDEILKN